MTVRQATRVLALLAIGAGVSACIGGGPPVPDATTAAPSAVAQEPHLGDGVCAHSLATYGFILGPLSPGLRPAHTLGEAVAAEQRRVDSLPDGAGGYFALVDAGVPALTHRPTWVIEWNGVNFSGPGQPYRTGAPSAPQQFLHHVVYLLYDNDLTEEAVLSCP